jgi:hypothetical protein
MLQVSRLYSRRKYFNNTTNLLNFFTKQAAILLYWALYEHVFFVCDESKLGSRLGVFEEFLLMGLDCI